MSSQKDSAKTIIVRDSAIPSVTKRLPLPVGVKPPAKVAIKY